jgi:hypothetical protein
MIKTQRTWRHPAGTALALAALALAAAPAAASASGTTSVAITGGSLGFVTAPVPGNFSPVTLNGSVQTTTATIPNWSVNDATGSLLGWNVKISATQFTTGGATPLLLPVGSMTYTPPSAVTAQSGQLAALAPTALPSGAAIDGSAARQIVLAAVGDGGGQWGFTQGTGALTLTLAPGTATAGTYSSTVTTTLTQGIT